MTRGVDRPDDLVLSNEAFDLLVTELDEPARPVPELIRLFVRYPKIRDA